MMAGSGHRDMAFSAFHTIEAKDLRSALYYHRELLPKRSVTQTVITFSLFDPIGTKPLEISSG